MIDMECILEKDIFQGLNEKWKLQHTKPLFKNIFRVENIQNPIEQAILKISKKEGGELFCEVHCYIRIIPGIEDWKKTHQLEFLGIPRFYGHGVIRDLRYIIIGKYLRDVSCHNTIITDDILKAIACCVIDVLEYIHHIGYVHADIKPANILVGNEKEFYLSDYGLAHKYLRDGVHIKYDIIKNRMRDGTLEFASTDAQRGVRPSRRSDMESLGYTLLFLSVSKLPWIGRNLDIVSIRKKKESMLGDIPHSFTCLDWILPNISDQLVRYFSMLTLGYRERPDYSKFRAIFT